MLVFSDFINATVLMHTVSKHSDIIQSVNDGGIGRYYTVSVGLTTSEGDMVT